MHFQQFIKTYNSVCYHESFFSAGDEEVKLQNPDISHLFSTFGKGIIKSLKCISERFREKI
jgi:hypothetical protein